MYSVEIINIGNAYVLNLNSDRAREEKIPIFNSDCAISDLCLSSGLLAGNGDTSFRLYTANIYERE